MQVNTQQKWSAIIRQQAQSTLTIKQFCLQQKISPSTFYQRKSELASLVKDEHTFIKASVSQTVEVATQVKPIRLTMGKAELSFPSQTSPSYLASLINELRL
ncbi:IS66 family insertion sequence element accessory protein TnpA [Colwellia sp. E150_009]